MSDDNTKIETLESEKQKLEEEQKKLEEEQTKLQEENKSNTNKKIKITDKDELKFKLLRIIISRFIRNTEIKDEKYKNSTLPISSILYKLTQLGLTKVDDKKLINYISGNESHESYKIDNDKRKLESIKSIKFDNNNNNNNVIFLKLVNKIYNFFDNTITNDHDNTITRDDKENIKKIVTGLSNSMGDVKPTIQMINNLIILKKNYRLEYLKESIKNNNNKLTQLNNKIIQYKKEAAAKLAAEEEILSTEIGLTILIQEAEQKLAKERIEKEKQEHEQREIEFGLAILIEEDRKKKEEARKQQEEHEQREVEFGLAILLEKELKRKEEKEKQDQEQREIEFGLAILAEEAERKRIAEDEEITRKQREHEEEEIEIGLAI